MATIRNSLADSGKATEATGFGLLSQPPNNVTDLYRDESESSEQPTLPMVSKPKQNVQAEPENQHYQLKKFIQKADRLNQLSFRRLHWDKSVMPQTRNLQIYKSNKNVLEELGATPMASNLRSIYLKPKSNKKSTSNRHTDRNGPKHKRKLTCDNKLVQTQLTIEVGEDLVLSQRQKRPAISRLSRTLRAIDEDDQETLPIKRKATKRVFNTIQVSANSDCPRLNAHDYLANVSRVEHSFTSSVRRYSLRQQAPQNTVFNGENKLENPIAKLAILNPWQEQSPNQCYGPQKHDIEGSKTVRPRNALDTEEQPEGQGMKNIKLEGEHDFEQTSDNSLVVQNNKSTRISQAGQAHSAVKDSPASNSSNQNQLFSFSGEIYREPKYHTRRESSVQMPQIRQIAVGTETNSFVKPVKKPIHPINISFGDTQSNWISQHFKPKSSFITAMDTSNFHIKKYRNGVYFGMLNQQGQKHGKGVIFYFNGRSYEGSFINDMKEGKGFEYSPDGATYSGDFKKGLKEGKGVYEWHNGEVYEGQWLAGKKNGSGMWKSPGGDSYLGQWKNGRIEGFGVLTVREGNRYQGQFKASMKSGYGTERYSNGDTYVGQFVKNRPNGLGEYYYCNGDTYKGMFSNGLKHGEGTLKTASGGLFQGWFQNDKKCGYGSLQTASGTYKGNFQNDLQHGYGEQTSDDIKVSKGYWINGQLVKQEMPTIEQTDLERQQSIQMSIKLPKSKRNEAQRRSSKAQSKQKKKSIQRNISKSPECDGDPKYHRACGCKRKH